MNRDCTACAEPAEPADRFCEACGEPLPAPEGPEGPEVPGVPAEASGPAGATGPDGPATAAGPRRTDLRADADALRPCPCGTRPTVGGPGVCDTCGRPRPDGRDHVEASVPGAAALTDRGLVRARNEDAYGVVTLPGGITAAVVCDGVASVPGGAEASLVACEAASDAAAASVDEPSGSRPGGPPAAAEDLARRGAEAARAAVAALAAGRPDPPACTYVGAVVTAEEIAVAWVGDSRAYWIADRGDGDGGHGDPRDDGDRGDDATRVLTVDDSWAAEVIALGLLDPADAWTDRRAHVITRWLAADAPDLPVRTATLRPDGPGALLLCSDGLWNHLPDAETLASLHRRGGGTADLAGSARAMLRAALDDGGHDNTTLVLVAGGTRHPREPREPA